MTAAVASREQCEQEVSELLAAARPEAMGLDTITGLLLMLVRRLS